MVVHDAMWLCENPLYIYIFYNVRFQRVFERSCWKDLSQIALFGFSIANFKSSSISIKNEHSNITLFSMTYRHTQQNITEHYRTLHRLPPFNTIYSSISRPDTFYSHLTLVTKYDIVYVLLSYILYQRYGIPITQPERNTL